MMRQDEASGNNGIDPKANRILAALEPDSYEELIRKSSIVPLKFRKSLIHEDQAADAVYFPLNMLISLLLVADGEVQMEIADVGREGVVGALGLLQEQRTGAIHFVRTSGAALRINAADFRQIASRRPQLPLLIYEHQSTVMKQMMIRAVCNHAHGIYERCACWLLLNHDRVRDDTFPLTQELFSKMLGVRRASINVATGKLKKAGAISFVRGKFTIIDRRRLESVSCECYQASARARNSLALPTT